MLSNQTTGAETEKESTRDLKLQRRWNHSCVEPGNNAQHNWERWQKMEAMQEKFSTFMIKAFLGFVCSEIHKLETQKRPPSGYQVAALDEFRAAREQLDPGGEYQFKAPVTVKRGPRKPAASPKS